MINKRISNPDLIKLGQRVRLPQFLDHVVKPQTKPITNKMIEDMIRK